MQTVSVEENITPSAVQGKHVTAGSIMKIFQRITKNTPKYSRILSPSKPIFGKSHQVPKEIEMSLQ